MTERTENQTKALAAKTAAVGLLRELILADRTSLVSQAKLAFTKLLPNQTFCALREDATPMELF